MRFGLSLHDLQSAKNRDNGQSDDNHFELKNHQGENPGAFRESERVSVRREAHRFCDG